jgi:hypothetical protein
VARFGAGVTGRADERIRGTASEMSSAAGNPSSPSRLVGPVSHAKAAVLVLGQTTHPVALLQSILSRSEAAGEVENFVFVRGRLLALANNPTAFPMVHTHKQQLTTAAAFSPLESPVGKRLNCAHISACFVARWASQAPEEPAHL